MRLLQSVSNRFKSLYLEVVNKIQVFHELDYPKRRLFLCNNIRLAGCHKEPDTVRWIEGFEKDDVVFDVGANVGAYSLIMACYAKHVYSFEPAFMNFSLLCKNIHENVRLGTISNNLTPFNVALAEKTGLETLNYVNVNLGKSGHQIGGRTIDGYGKSFSPTYFQKVMAFSLDSLIETFAIPTPNHMKIDVDGIEFEILMGGDKTLSRPELRSLLVEADFNLEKYKNLVKYLVDKGFKLNDKLRITGVESNYGNCLFTRA
ncbi:MAG TPA: FkbM family methyltransferase [Candidatus Omnitrophota bacterium]|nr:FkbM family methyltransferase [Candidatus Omnitrophota bacterium]